MATKNTEEKSVTGLGEIPAKEYKDAEYDLVTALLEAAEFKTSDDNILMVKIERAGKFLFAVRIRPLSDTEVKKARKEAGIYRNNPAGKKLGKIRVDTDEAKFGSWLIYLATIEEDQKKIWNNPSVMQKFSLMEPWESIDILLTSGEKNDLLEEVFKLSGLKEDEDEDEDEDKDKDKDEEVKDEETFRA